MTEKDPLSIIEPTQKTKKEENMKSKGIYFFLFVFFLFIFLGAHRLIVPAKEEKRTEIKLPKEYCVFVSHSKIQEE